MVKPTCEKCGTLLTECAGALADYTAKVRELAARRTTRIADLPADENVSDGAWVAAGESLRADIEGLEGECWRPDDGAAEAARVVWTASSLVDEASVRAWAAARTIVGVG